MRTVVNNLEGANGFSSGSAEEDFKPIHIDATVAMPGLMICRFKAPLCYAKAEFFMNDVPSIARTAPSRLRWFILRFDSIENVDYVAAKMLTELADRMGTDK